jgi:RHS repeat-associated protein
MQKYPLVKKLVGYLLVVSFLASSTAPAYANENHTDIPVIPDIGAPVAQEFLENNKPSLSTDDSVNVSEEANEPTSISTDKNKKISDDIREDPNASSVSSTASTGVPDPSSIVTQNKSPKVDETSGSLVYNYPFKVPPGRNGFSPEVNLIYSSQNSEDTNIVGYGWSIDIPYIERLNRTGSEKLYTENYFTSSLTGELVSLDGINFSSKVENGSFLKYTLSNNVWAVIDKIGKQYKFGLTLGSRQDKAGDTSKVYKWMLEEVRDTNGNYIKYEYFKDTGQIYPSKIVYTGNGTTNGIFEIEFFRQTRSDAMVSYESGFLVKSNFRISEIQSKVNNSWIAKYLLGYTTGANGSRSMLQSVTESGKDDVGNIVTSPATQFNYQMSTVGWDYDNATWQAPEQINEFHQLVDLNGDSLLDIIKSYFDNLGGGTGIKKATYINTGSNTWIPSTNLESPIYFRKREVRGGVYNNIWDQGVRIGDINGDQYPDIIKGLDGPNSEYTAYLNNAGTSWVQDPSWAPIIGFDEGPDNGGNTGNIGVYGTQLFDMNGDNLPDIKKTSEQLNIGFGYSIETDSWNLPSPVSVSSHHNRIADVNNDGLNDILHSSYEDNGFIFNNFAYLNKGDQAWVSESSFASPSRIVNENNDDQGMRFLDINGDGLTDVVRDNLNKGSWINTGTGWSALSNPWELPFGGGLMIQGIIHEGDFNSDGLIDFMMGSATQTEVWRHKGLIPDLLSHITYTQGGSTDITYQKTAQYRDSSNNLLNPNLPANLTTVKTIIDNDGLGLASTNTYSYEGGKYFYNGPTDRKFSGFTKIKKIDAAGNVTTTFYHQGNTSNSAQGEYNDEMWKIGKPYRVEMVDGSGNIYQKTINKWDSFDLGSGSKFVKLAQRVDSIFDGNTTHRDKAESYTYNDGTGNITQKVDFGEVIGSDDGTFVDTGNDKLTTNITYATGSTLGASGLPSQETTLDQSAIKVRETKNYYDLLAHGSVDKGNLTKQEQWKTGTTYFDTEKIYNNYGLVTQEKDPRDKLTNYIYDSFNLYPASITNTLNQTTQYVYDYSLGKPKQVTDSNNRIFQTIYDGLDRVIEEKQPDPAAPTSLLTKATYVYSDTPLQVSIKKTDFLDGTTNVDSYMYFDGLGRPIQTRIEAEDVNVFAAKDVIYNNLAQIQKESLPYFSTGSSKTPATTDVNLYSTYNYDPILRVTSTQNAVGTVTNTYDDWKLTITDARGKSKNLYRDAQGQLIKVEELNSGNTYTTLYEYNGNGNLIKVTDALSNIRNFNYDGLGRRINAEDLHAPGDTSFGNWTYTYDDSGNLLSKLDPKGQLVSYTYDDINRVLTEDFNGIAGVQANYTYDTCLEGVGRLCSVEQVGTSLETLQYNALGQTTRSAKNINSINYQTDYTYDREGNQLAITNPDGSQVKNIYNTAGQLEQVQRKETTDGSFINVVTDFDYGPHGKVTYQVHQNGSATTNVYDATKLYRLGSKLTTISGGLRAQDSTYLYDNNGNITQIVDNSQTDSKKTVTYTYDDLNRLLTSSATGVAAGQSTYSHNFTYDALGNILTHVETIGAGSPVTFTYTYAGNQGANFANPHAVTSISDGTNNTTYIYDNNGNMTADGAKIYVFDYNNRLEQATVPGSGGGSSTTTSFAATGGDGSITFNSSTSWPTTHDATTGSSVTTGTTLKVNSGKANGGKYTIERGFTPFNTAALPDNATITAAKLKVLIDSKSDSDNDGDDWVTVVQGSQPSTASLAISDYDLAGSVNSPTEGINTAERKDITGVTTGQYLEFNLNSAGQSWVSKTGDTKLALREGHDVINSAFTGSNSTSNQLVLRTGEYAGTSSDPVLEVTYTTPPPAITMTYGYDPSGKRVKYSNGTTTTIYPNDSYNTDGTTIQKHIFAGGIDLGTVKGTGVGAAIFYTHTDHLTGSSVVSNTTGTQEELMDYFPFGSIRLDQKAGTFSEQRKFTGLEYDMDTGLNYANARYYHASIGRFISQDPVFLALGNGGQVKQLTGQELQAVLSDPQNLNSYAYARNNPIINTDQDGLFSLNPINLFSYNTQVTIGNWANSAYANNSVARYALDHPYQAGAAIGIVGGAAVGIGVVAGGGAITCGILCGGAAATVATGGTALATQGNRIANYTSNFGPQLGSKMNQVASNLGNTSYKFTDHAIMRIAQRVGVGNESKVINALNMKPFQYFHEGVQKLGYYDPSSKILVGQVKSSSAITTIITNVSKNYVNNLISK